MNFQHIAMILFFIIVGYLWQNFAIRQIISSLQDTVKKAADAIREAEHQEIDNQKEVSEGVKEERKWGVDITTKGSEEYIDYRTSALGFITQIVGWIEILFFGALVAYLTFDQKLNSQDISLFLQIFGGWVAIKTVVSYDQWSHKYVGKAYFYVSLFGTLMNIALASFIGPFFVHMLLST